MINKLSKILFVMSLFLGPALLAVFCFLSPGNVDLDTRKFAFMVVSVGYEISEATLYILTRYIFRDGL